MKNYNSSKTYLVLIADRKQAKLFTLFKGTVSSLLDFSKNDVPQKVKHGSNTWDAQDKINRHIQEHLHQHLNSLSAIVKKYVKENPVDGILIGGHKNLFVIIKKHLPYPLSKKVIGNFVTELKVPLNTISKKAIEEIEKLELADTRKRVNSM